MGCLLIHLEGCLLYKQDAAEFSKVFITSGEHDIGRCILCQHKSTESKILLGDCPKTFLLHDIATRYIPLLATRADFNGVL